MYKIYCIKDDFFRIFTVYYIGGVVFVDQIIQKRPNNSKFLFLFDIVYASIMPLYKASFKSGI